MFSCDLLHRYFFFHTMYPSKYLGRHKPEASSQRGKFPSSPARRSDCQSSSSSQGPKRLDSPFTRADPPPSHLCLPAVTARHYYDRVIGGVVMAAGRTAELCAAEKDSLPERHTHSPARPPPDFFNPFQTLGNTKNFTFITKTHRCTHGYAHNNACST